MRSCLHKISRLFLIAALLVPTTEVFAEKAATNKPITATLVSYECGDNCYLTIADAEGNQRTGLCAAPLCDKWNQTLSMPDRLKGKKVRLVVGTGQQFDGGGNLMGTTDAFMQIEVLK